MKTKIYLLPGLMCDERLWSRIASFLNEKYELIHLSIPLLNSFDEICEYLYTHIEDEKINLLGFSLGGYIASYFAIKYPQRVKRLFVIAATLCSLSKDEKNKRKETLELIEKYGFKGISRKKVISLLLKENANDNELISLVQEMYVDLGYEVFKTQMTSSLDRKNLLEGFLELSVPVIYCYSTEDRLLDYGWIKDFTDLNNKARCVLIEGNSHMLPLEKPSTLSFEIKSWLKIPEYMA